MLTCHGQRSGEYVHVVLGSRIRRSVYLGQTTSEHTGRHRGPL